MNLTLFNSRATMTTQAAVALGRLRSMLAAEAVVYRLATLAATCKANFNPNQPRVPAGNSDGGQWTNGGGDGGDRGRPRGGVNDPHVLSDAREDDKFKPGGQYAQVGPRGPRGQGAYRTIGGRRTELTQTQQVQAEIAESQAASAINRVRMLDPNWRPTRRTESTTDQYIENTRETAREAQARYETLRTGIGGNFGPPLTSPSPPTAVSPPPSQRFDGQAWIGAYREVHVRRDLFGNQIPLLTKDDTVAVAEFNGKPIFGVNSTASTYTDADSNAADRYLDVLIRKYPETMSTGNIGQMPNNAMRHAEVSIITRAAASNGGVLAGRHLTVHVDKEVCVSCKQVLPKLGLEIGNPAVTFIDKWGKVLTMRSGIWLD
jgi:hypothetical protein